MIYKTRASISCCELYAINYCKHLSLIGYGIIGDVLLEDFHTCGYWGMVPKSCFSSSHWKKHFRPHPWVVGIIVALCFSDLHQLWESGLLSVTLYPTIFGNFALERCSNIETVVPDIQIVIHQLTSGILHLTLVEQSLLFPRSGRDQHCYFHCSSVRTFYFHCSGCSGSHNQ